MIAKLGEKLRIATRCICLYIVTFFLMLIGELAGSLIQRIPGATTGDVVSSAGHYLASIGIWGVFVLVLVIFPKNRPLLQTLWTKAKGNTIKMLIVGVLIGFGTNFFCILVAMLCGNIQLTFSRFEVLPLLLLLIAVLIQSSGEELVCRVFLYQKILREYKSPIAAIIGNALFFSLLHLANSGVTALSLSNITLIGIFFSLIVYYTDSFWCVSAAHFSWNFTQNIIFGLPNSGQTVPFSIFVLNPDAMDGFAYNVGFGVEGTVLTNMVFVLACVLIWQWGKKRPALQSNI